jgi:hypothetical protein
MQSNAYYFLRDIFISTRIVLAINNKFVPDKKLCLHYIIHHDLTSNFNFLLFVIHYCI